MQVILPQPAIGSTSDEATSCTRKLHICTSENRKDDMIGWYIWHLHCQLRCWLLFHLVPNRRPFSAILYVVAFVVRNLVSRFVSEFISGFVSGGCQLINFWALLIGYRTCPTFRKFFRPIFQSFCQWEILTTPNICNTRIASKFAEKRKFSEISKFASKVAEMLLFWVVWLRMIPLEIAFAALKNRKIEKSNMDFARSDGPFWDHCLRKFEKSKNRSFMGKTFSKYFRGY